MLLKNSNFFTIFSVFLLVGLSLVASVILYSGGIEKQISVDIPALDNRRLSEASLSMLGEAAAFVNNMPIYKKDIDVVRLLQQISLEQNRQAVQKSNLSENEKKARLASLDESVMTDAEILEKLIEYTVVSEEAAKHNVQACDEEAEIYAKLANDWLFETEQTALFKELNATLTKWGVSFEEYVEKWQIPFIKQSLNRRYLLDWYVTQKGLSKQSEEKQQKAFESYTNFLIGQSFIQYVK